MRLNYLNLTLATVLLLGVFLFSSIPTANSWGPGPNYKNVSVRTTVNVTDSRPEILNTTCDNNTITLIAGSVKQLSCLVSIRDYNGGNSLNGSDGSGVNATMHYFLNTSADPDDNNVHYTNNSCTVNGTPNGYYINYSCSFPIWYYANNGTWTVTPIVLDKHNDHNYTTNSTFNVTILPLYALNVTNLIDYGSLAVGDTSPTPIVANITNFGNMDINVSLYGFGGETDTAQARAYAMFCEVRNLTIANERYALSAGTAFPGMVPLTGSISSISGLTISHQLNDSQQVTNSTYWRLQVNVSENPYGVCNGTIVLSADAS